jgi:hypothetical protein
MGSNASAQIERTVNEATNKTTILAQQQIVQTNQDNTNITQTINVEIKGKLTCADFILSNDAKLSVGSLSQATADQKVDMAQLVAQALDVAASTELEQENSGINPLQSNLSFIVREAINRSRNEQEASMIQTFEQTVSHTADVSQTINFIVTETAEVIVSGTCSFNNTTSIEYTSQMVTNAAMEVVTSQEDVQEAATAWDTSIKQKNKGLSPGVIAAIIIAVILLLIIIGVPSYLAYKKKKEAGI